MPGQRAGLIAHIAATSPESGIRATVHCGGEPPAIFQDLWTQRGGNHQIEQIAPAHGVGPDDQVEAEVQGPSPGHWTLAVLVRVASSRL